MHDTSPIESPIYWPNGSKMINSPQANSTKIDPWIQFVFVASNVHFKIIQFELGWNGQHDHSSFRNIVSLLIETCLTATVAHTTNQLLSFHMVWYRTTERHRARAQLHSHETPSSEQINCMLHEFSRNLATTRVSSRTKAARVIARKKGIHTIRKQKK